MAGDSGIAIAGLIGGLTSSTAATVTMSNLAREHPQQTRLLTAGVLFSNATMMLRVLVIVALIDFALFSPLLAPLISATLVLAGAELFWMFRAISETKGNESLQLKNPLDLVTVLKFGLLLTIVMVVAKIATNLSGDAGLYGLAAMSGVADVDAITLSTARLAREGLNAEVGARAIAIAVAANTASKAALGWYGGGAAFGRRLALVSVLAILTGLAAMMLAPSPQF